MNSCTKGKWESGKNTGIWCGKKMLALIMFCLDEKQPFKVCEEEAEANAHLITAAINACKEINLDNPIAVAEALPDLLKACEAIVRDFEDEDSLMQIDPASCTHVPGHTDLCPYWLAKQGVEKAKRQLR